MSPIYFISLGASCENFADRLLCQLSYYFNVEVDILQDKDFLSYLHSKIIGNLDNFSISQAKMFTNFTLDSDCH